MFLFQIVSDKQTGGAVSYASFSQTQPSANANPQSSIQYQPSSQPKDLKPQQQVVYLKNQIAPQSYEQQTPYQQYSQGVLLQNSGFPVENSLPVQSPGFQDYVQQPLAVAPTFAPVQYFGKFAQSIFGYPQQRWMLRFWEIVIQDLKILINWFP